MKKKKVFTEKEIKQALYSIYKKTLVDNDFMNDNSYACGYMDALIDVFCHIFDESLCPVNFGVDKEIRQRQEQLFTDDGDFWGKGGGIDD